MCVLYKPKHLRHHTCADEQICYSAYILLRHKSARISKAHDEMVGQIFRVFSLETKLLTFSSMLKNFTEKFQKVILKDLSLWKYPFLPTLPSSSNWLKQNFVHLNFAMQQLRSAKEARTLYSEAMPCCQTFLPHKILQKAVLQLTVTSPQNKI